MPYHIHTILADNGIQFAEQPRNRTTTTSRLMRFDMIWLADNGHIYKYVAINHFWSGAVTAAADEIAGQSYLATSTSAAEDALIDTLGTGRTHLALPPALRGPPHELIDIIIAGLLRCYRLRI